MQHITGRVSHLVNPLKMVNTHNCKEGGGRGQNKTKCLPECREFKQGSELNQENLLNTIEILGFNGSVSFLFVVSSRDSENEICFWKGTVKINGQLKGTSIETNFITPS